MFNPRILPGEVITNRQLMSTFRCACEGGIRYSSRTDTIVLVINNTQSGRPNIWKDGILEFAGQITKNGETLQGANRRLEEFLRENGDIFLFEVNEPRKYEFKGRVQQAGEIRFATTPQGGTYPVFPVKVG